jgi:hypothetical protein
MCCDFGTDPDPRIRTTDFRIRILLFSSMAFKMPTKNRFVYLSFFLLIRVLFEGTFTSVFKDKKSCHKTVEIKVFLTFFC